MHSFLIFRLQFLASLIPGAVAGGLGAHGALVGRDGNWLGGEVCKTVTPFVLFLQSPMSFQVGS